MPSEIECINVGYEVAVLARARKAYGWVTELITDESEVHKRTSEFRLKPILSAIPAFLPEQLSLYLWISQYYGHPLAETIDCTIPQFRKRRVTSKGKKKSEEKLASNTAHILTGEQQVAVDKLVSALENKTFKPFLLFGVTGSGKTEVYLQTLKRVIAEGSGAIVIVPEIALTPQLSDYFETKLGQEIALLHSELSSSDRQKMWEKIYQNKLKIVLGARSAIFAPVQDLRIVIVDEEHESSFKQSDSLRYNARDVAIVLAKQRNCVTLLGSATPSFESLINVKRGSYELLELKERANTKPVPAIEIIDLSKIKRSEMISSNISPPFYDRLKETLDCGEQAVILYNRRGFASYLQCSTCQNTVLCPNCSVTLTYHKNYERMLCHYCGLRIPPPQRCGHCLDPRTTAVEDVNAAVDRGNLELRGSGTERVVEEFKSLFPGVSLLQMDRDTVTSKDSYREILTAMRAGKAQLLVGTQMIAKGHDLPGVTFVGIVDADIGLNTPDFRASERALQLITQAAGRAGRGEKAGKVFIQTRQPNHPTIVAASTGRFMAFARYELEKRKQLQYPPFGRLMRLIVSSENSVDALLAADKIQKKISELIPEIIRDHEDKIKFATLGPAPAPHERLRGRYRHHILVKCNSATALSRLAGAILLYRGELKTLDDARVAIDVDPMEML